jgi:hypothetical protein
MVTIGVGGKFERLRTTHWTGARVSISLIVELAVAGLMRARSIRALGRSAVR